jgi:hypothetical protein
MLVVILKLVVKEPDIFWIFNIVSDNVYTSDKYLCKAGNVVDESMILLGVILCKNG